MSGPVPEPLSITADVDERIVAIEWADGVRSLYDFEQLRWSCPCATCRGEMGRPGLLDRTDRLAPEQTDLDDIVQVGRYAVCPIWCDGHSTGIYTYQYLRELDRDGAGRRS
jgi:DUF971 family protein